jgi:hypothetical protein
VFEFIEPYKPHSPDPRHDLDRVSAMGNLFRPLLELKQAMR